MRLAHFFVGLWASAFFAKSLSAETFNDLYQLDAEKDFSVYQKAVVAIKRDFKNGWPAGLEQSRINVRKVASIIDLMSKATERELIDSSDLVKCTRLLSEPVLKYGDSYEAPRNILAPRPAFDHFKSSDDRILRSSVERSWLMASRYAKTIDDYVEYVDAPSAYYAKGKNPFLDEKGRVILESPKVRGLYGATLEDVILAKHRQLKKKYEAKFASLIKANREKGEAQMAEEFRGELNAWLGARFEYFNEARKASARPAQNDSEYGKKIYQIYSELDYEHAKKTAQQFPDAWRASRKLLLGFVRRNSNTVSRLGFGTLCGIVRDAFVSLPDY